MEAKLVPIAGPDDVGEVILYPDETIVIGRAESCDVQVRQSKVSRHHCRVDFVRGFYTVEDLESKNGTWVNNRRVKTAVLFHHDRLVVGDTEFRFILSQGSGDESNETSVSSARQPVFETEIREPAGPGDASSLLGELRPERSPSRSDFEHRFSVICDIINSINAENDLDRLLEVVMDRVMDVISADRGYLISGRTPDAALMPLVSRNRRGLPEDAQDNFSRSVVLDCFRTETSLLLADPGTRMDPSESIITQNIQSIMAVPMSDGEETVGVLYVDRVLGSRPFSKNDLRLLSAIGNQAGVAIRRAQLTEQVETLFRDSMRTVINLVEVKDEYTYGHSERVTELAQLIWDLCGLGTEESRDIELAGLLHDVGKLAVRLDILQKPTRLTPAEYEVIRHHPVTGSAVMANVAHSEHIADAVRHHHERWDGQGYPDGLSAENIPLLARVLAIADAFDSMASARPYRNTMDWDEIIAELHQGSGTQFDPYLAERFVEALEHDEQFLNKIKQVYRQKIGPDTDQTETTQFE
jgi:HD-GYP domain-containing protein (c-di-GMP phosphodiesterase class II)/pSer/pThr/pTyr-binding forkhead associated (FHA) protein